MKFTKGDTTGKHRQSRGQKKESRGKQAHWNWGTAGLYCKRRKISEWTVSSFRSPNRLLAAWLMAFYEGVLFAALAFARGRRLLSREDAWASGLQLDLPVDLSGSSACCRFWNGRHLKKFPRVAARAWSPATAASTAPSHSRRRGPTAGVLEPTTLWKLFGQESGLRQRAGSRGATGVFVPLTRRFVALFHWERNLPETSFEFLTSVF